MHLHLKTMRTETWQRVEDLFHNTVDLTPAARSIYLDTHCHDTNIRQYVEHLIASDLHSHDYVQRVIETEALALISHSILPGETLGAYRITKEVQSGGMGTVFLAERADEAYHKQVAIKVLRNRLATDEDIQSFRNERQILADLEHINIARLLDGGTCEDGSPYLVMEYVEGEPIDDYCRTRKLNLEKRLMLFLDVCGALAYAHRFNIIHGDIKPENILVTDDGVAKLLDFGIAALSGRSRQDSSTIRPVAQQRLTPEYASPEQLSGEDISVTSDVYSLGVLLYELLTDELPYKLQNGSSSEWLELICKTRPSEPSSVVGKSITGSDVLFTHRKIRGELDKIVFKAVHKLPAERYATSVLLADDIQRYLHHEQVMAHAPTAVYRLGKWLRRQRIVVGLVLLSILSIFMGGMLLQQQLRQADMVQDILAGHAVTQVDPATTVAILPFSAEPEGVERILAAGITDQLITRLSTIKGLMVIARNSVLPYVQASITRSEIARELGVRYLVYGALQHDKNKIKLQLHVLDNQTQQVVLTKNLDGQVDDIFTLHDQLLRQVIETLLITPSAREQQLVEHRFTQHSAAYQAFVRGLELYNQRNKEANENARQEFLHAVELDPGFARAMATLANTYRADYVNGWSTEPNISIQEAESLVQRALDMDGEIAQVHFVMALVQRAQKRHQQALSHSAEAIAINPNYADAFTLMASILCYSGQPESSLALINKAQRLNPKYPVNYPFHSGVCNFTQGQYVAAAESFETVLSRNPASQRATLWLTASYAHNGNIDDAKWKLAELLAWNPGLSLSQVANSIPYQNKDDMDRLLDGLRKAGLPE